MPSKDSEIQSTLNEVIDALNEAIDALREVQEQIGGEVHTIWNDEQAGEPSQDSDAVVVGTEFKPSVDGEILGIRWQKAEGGAGASVVALWRGDENVSGNVTVADQEGSGWQEEKFPSPIPVNAGETYTAAALYGPIQGPSYFYETAFFNEPFQSGQLSATKGVYVYSEEMERPTEVWALASYFVDVLFSPRK